MTEPTLNFHIQTHQTQFKIPVELIKKNFKTIQKLIEKQKKQLTDDIAKIKRAQALSSAAKLELIQRLIRNFEAFQKKLTLAVKKDEEFRSRLITRLENLLELLQFVAGLETKGAGEEGEREGAATGGNGDDEADKVLDLHNPNLINWYRDQTNLLIIDYLIKSNTRSDANIGLLLLKNLAETNPKLMKLIDYDLFENFNQVFVSIVQDHDLTMIIAWFNENRNALKKISSNLEFEINYCKFLTLIEKGDINEAINYSRENLSSYGNKENYSDQDSVNHAMNLERLKSLGGLLVFRSMEQEENSNSLTFSNKLMINSVQFKEYQKLLSNERWESLSQCFIENFTKLYGITKNYPIYIYLSAGLSSLKTKSCYHNAENTIFKDPNAAQDAMEMDKGGGEEEKMLTDRKYRGPNHYYQILNKINNCPVCSPELFKLSQNLPYAQLITNIFNNPFKLPNGNIYPFDKLLSPNDKYLLEKNTLLRLNKIKDPLTKEIFYIDHCIRVFPA
ncbi:Protein FYV10 [Candida viswanathii]|uniref:Protein FYV10 n=1 Tax=Candida viswanathii TaxID=5486 RepID=A0A367XZM8_9ASCO|nr:Protein FYV10 [Candida viswanathii]